MTAIRTTGFTPEVRRNRRLHNGYTVIAREETFGERLRRLRTQHGWPCDELGRRAGVAKTTVNAAELRGSVTAATLARLAGALGVTMDYLWLGMEQAS